jgi:hypothetical protein
VLEGGCSRGSVRLTSEPLIVHCVLIEADRVELVEGQVALFSEYGRPEVRFLRLPAFDGYHDTRELWPAASLERVGRVLGRSVE